MHAHLQDRSMTAATHALFANNLERLGQLKLVLCALVAKHEPTAADDRMQLII